MRLRLLIESKYLTLKNQLYNYLLRKRAIEKCLQQEKRELIYEVGSRITHVVTNFKCTISSDLSIDAFFVMAAQVSTVTISRV